MGYERSKFRHWIDTDTYGRGNPRRGPQNGNRQPARRGAALPRSGGEWYSPYDDRYIQGPRGLDIDHLVPLAEAWDSGASAWSPAERQAYANDPGDARALIAVSAASNRSKADQDPATWLPPAAGSRCQYVTDWVADKTRWDLSIDTSEEAALSQILSHCPNTPVTVTLAR